MITKDLISPCCIPIFLRQNRLFIDNITEPTNSFASVCEVKRRKRISFSAAMANNLIIIKALGSGINIDFPKVSDAAVLYCKTVVDVSLTKFKEIPITNTVNKYKEDVKDVPRDKNDMTVITKDLSAHISNDRTMISQASAASFANKFLIPVITRALLPGAGRLIMLMIMARSSISCWAYQKRREEEFGSSLLWPRDLMFKCALYRINLAADGIYLPLLVKNLRLVEEIYDLVHHKPKKAVLPTENQIELLALIL
ncbi:hypothetical protein AB4K20DRAFT_1862584 [Rhizopus microsporus]